MGLFRRSKRKQAHEALVEHHMAAAEQELARLGLDPGLVRNAGSKQGMAQLIAQTQAQSEQIAADGIAAYQASLAAGAPAPAAGDVQEDPLDALARLGELRAAGAITEEQFAAEKARLLGT